MADVIFNQFIIDSFRYKLYKNPHAQTFRDPRFGYNLPYTSRGNIRGIFEYARIILPSVYTHSFPDTEGGNLQMARKIIENLDQKRDFVLVNYFNETTAPELNQEIAAEIQTASKQMDAVPPTAEQPATQAAAPIPPSPGMQIPKIPTAAGQAAKGLGSKAGIFFKKNIGKHLTIERIATGVSAGIGAVAGASFGPVGAIAGGFGGALLPSWIKNGDAGRFFSRVGNGILDAGGRLSLQIGRGRSLAAKGASRWIWIFLGVFFLIILGSGVIGALPGDIPTDQTGTPVTQPTSPFEEEVPPAAPVVQQVTPTADDCQGKYTSWIAKNPDKINFGDPLCDFLGPKDSLYKMLKQQDPVNADFWYLIAACESTYNPNAYFRCNNSGTLCSPDPAGAWGLFQMGRGLNGIYDHGDVVWQSQISNAINYNRNVQEPNGINLGSKDSYWACARPKPK